MTICISSTASSSSTVTTLKPQCLNELRAVRIDQEHKEDLTRARKADSLCTPSAEI
jgi:hypothetical protein